MKPPFGLTLSLLIAAGCGGGGGAPSSVSAPSNSSAPSPTAVPTATQPGSTSQCSGKTATTASPGSAPVAPQGLSVAGNLHIERVAQVANARELTALPNGDLLVGTSSSKVYLVPNAENAGAVGAPIVFATMPDGDAAGVTFDRVSCTVFVGTTNGVYAIPYNDADTSARNVTKIASLRTSSSGGHETTTVAVSNGTLFASVGSSCNACSETDPTRATIQQMHLDGSAMTARAVHIRNAIGLTVNPQSGHVWTGDAGQDSLPTGHPYEFVDDVSAHAGVADYGWPQCEENQQSYGSGASCSNTVTPLIELPAYSTIIGVVFYPQSVSGTYALPSTFRGGAFIAAHGSWHQVNGRYYALPQVVFVPMNGDTPQTPVNWSDPTKQWTPFLTGFQLSDGTTRIGRPTGLAVGAQGSLFVADDDAGVVYRIRP